MYVEESSHLSCSQGDEVLSSLRDSLPKQSNDDTAYVIVSDLDIEVYLRQGRGIMGIRVLYAQSKLNEDMFFPAVSDSLMR